MNRTLLAVLTTVLVWSNGARAEGCPEARSERLASHFDLAVEAARRCLASEPDDVGTWLELSRALGYKQAFDEALHWVERGLERYPRDVDLGVWRVRVLAWAGRHEAARNEFASLVQREPGLLRDRETAMLEVDLAFWSNDWSATKAASTRYLAAWPSDPDALRKRGIALLEEGQTSAAARDFAAGCHLGQAASCTLGDAVAQRAAPVDTWLAPRFGMSERGDEVACELGARVRIADGLRVGGGVEWRARSSGSETTASESSVDSAAGGREAAINDLSALVSAVYEGRRWGVEAGLQLGFDPVIAPELVAFVEPGFRLADSVSASLRYTRMSFVDAGAHILSPGIGLGFGPAELDLHYYLGFTDAGGKRSSPSAGATTHAGLVRARWHASEGWAFTLGGGAGTAADYLVLANSQVDGHWLVLGGVTWTPTWHHRFDLGYAFRRESLVRESALTSSAAENIGLSRHEFTASWRWTP